ncbi:MAG: FAD-dependent oxidoreductase [Rhodospirillum sp.]|nr:FAD-dependent oxidoreductase [Rhodospirillum sp.]MCF8488914.1 FAD-dependent oxidoreductase [Rhodospirillum sp.]
MTFTPLTVDLCVIGGGSAGLSVAAGAVQMGASVALVERGPMGGDCLNFGCVPSKALLAAAHAAQVARTAARFGVDLDPPRVDMARVRDHVRGVIAGIAPHDSVARFEDLGVSVFTGTARFTGRTALAVAGSDGSERVVTARRVVVATGSAPLVPPIPGLSDGPFLTNETLFDLAELPRRLLILGGGPVGCEMAQAFRRLGAEVHLVERTSLLNRDDPELVAVARTALAEEGIHLHEGMAARAVAWNREGPRLSIARSDGGGEGILNGSHLLVALGRSPNLVGLNLEAAGIDQNPKGIPVDSRLRTSNKKVFAIGDVAGDGAGSPRFTHVAGYHAGIVIKNTLFRLPAKVDLSACPRVTYLDPEIAQVGLTEAESKEKGVDYKVLRWEMAENDRARAEGATAGLVKVIVTPKGRILGVGIAGKSAGEVIQSWVLALHAGLKIGALATMIAPYPTLGEAGKRAAGSFYTDSLFGSRTRKLVRFLSRFG